MPSSLKLDDYSDPELLRLMHHHYGNGWATSNEIAELIGITDTKSPQVSVGIRLGYLRRHGGLVERDERPGSETLHHWRLTEMGEHFANGKLRKALTDQLGKIDDAQMLGITSLVTQRYRQHYGLATGTLIRREFQYGTSKKRFQ